MSKDIEIFEKFLDNISDEKLDSMISEIDKLGITGPTVEEYFCYITQAVSSFHDESSETSTIGQVFELFDDTKVVLDGITSYSIPMTFVAHETYVESPVDDWVFFTLESNNFGIAA